MVWYMVPYHTFSSYFFLIITVIKFILPCERNTTHFRRCRGATYDWRQTLMLLFRGLLGPLVLLLFLLLFPFCTRRCKQCQSLTQTRGQCSFLRLHVSRTSGSHCHKELFCFVLTFPVGSTYPARFKYNAISRLNPLMLLLQ